SRIFSITVRLVSPSISCSVPSRVTTISLAMLVPIGFLLQALCRALPVKSSVAISNLGNKRRICDGSQPAAAERGNRRAGGARRQFRACARQRGLSRTAYPRARLYDAAAHDRRPAGQ